MTEKIPEVSISEVKLMEYVSHDDDGKLIILYHNLEEQNQIQIRQCLYFTNEGIIYDYTFNPDFDKYAKMVLGKLDHSQVVSLHDVINYNLKRRDGE